MSPPLRGSMSRTTAPDTLPVTTPTFASGQRRHHAAICAAVGQTRSKRCQRTRGCLPGDGQSSRRHEHRSAAHCVQRDHRPAPRGVRERRTSERRRVVQTLVGVVSGCQATSGRHRTQGAFATTPTVIRVGLAAESSIAARRCGISACRVPRGQLPASSRRRARIARRAGCRPLRSPTRGADRRSPGAPRRSLANDRGCNSSTGSGGVTSISRRSNLQARFVFSLVSLSVVCLPEASRQRECEFADPAPSRSASPGVAGSTESISMRPESATAQGRGVRRVG